MKLNVSEQDLELFEKDLCKDIRKLKLDKDSFHHQLVRYSDKQISIKDEVRFLRSIEPHVTFKIPSIEDSTDSFIVFEYIPGTRAFNLLMDLRTIYLEDQSNDCISLGRLLINLLETDLKNFQSLFKSNNLPVLTNKHYPVSEKLKNLYQLFSSILSLEMDLDEIEKIADIYKDQAAVPFRDATPKNVILNIPSLYQKQFKTRKDRLDTVKKLISTGELKEKLKNKNIFHIDFSGSCHICPEKDDWIALKNHECSVWLDKSFEPDFDQMNQKDLVTFFVRLSRFGGRKLAYRLLNKDGHKIRFALDNEIIYFEALSKIVRIMLDKGLLTDKRYFSVMEHLKQATQLSPSKDYFLDWKKQQSKFQYYQDVFPN